MHNDLPPLKTWQFYNACKEILTETFLENLYKRGQRQIYRWCANPDATSDHQRNPLDRMKALFRSLAEVGRKDVAIIALRDLANTIGYEVNPKNVVIPDGDTIEDECLDDYPALQKFHEVARNGSDHFTLHHCYQEAKREIDETFAKAIG